MTTECPQLFEADVPPPTCLDPANLEIAKAPFEVEITREYVTKFYVLALSKEDAKVDAVALLDDLTLSDFEEIFSPDINVSEHDGPIPKGEPVWTGGPEGRWEP